MDHTSNGDGGDEKTAVPEVKDEISSGSDKLGVLLRGGLSSGGKFFSASPKLGNS